MKQSAMLLIGVLVIAVASVGVCGYIDATSTPSSDDSNTTEEVLDNLAEDNATDENVTDEGSSEAASSDSSGNSGSSSSSSSSQQSSSSSSSSSKDSGSSNSGSSSSSSSSDDDDYYYSPQHDDYITEWTDSDGVQHMKNKEGSFSQSYDERTGVMTTHDHGETYHDQMN